MLESDIQTYLKQVKQMHGFFDGGPRRAIFFIEEGSCDKDLLFVGATTFSKKFNILLCFLLFNIPSLLFLSLFGTAEKLEYN